MKCELSVSAEELAELNALLEREIQSSHVELRRTRNPEFRDQVQQHVDRLEGLLRQLTQAQAPAGTK